MERHLRFAPEILARLGEELVPHPELGIVELVRNAYDADATSCRISLTATDRPNDTLIVADDGDGMSDRVIQADFLLLGRSSKKADEYTASGRRKIGEKGLGRLAALRLGTVVELATRPKDDPGTEWLLRIDWARFDSVNAVEEVVFDILRRETDERHGTTIKIVGLRHEFRANELERLSRTLLLLTGPFPDAADFRVELDSQVFRDLAVVIGGTLFEEHVYKLEAELCADGRARATLHDWNGNLIAAAEHEEVAKDRRKSASSPALPRYETPPATLELWMFDRNLSEFRVHTAQQPRRQLRDWLDHVGGVHVYHRGLRVHPYGDPNNDWLDLNLGRARNPEERPSTNNSIGRVRLVDNEQALTPKTDRSGFTENLAFRDLRDFAQYAIDWAGYVRVKLREDKGREKVTTTRELAAKATDDLVKAVKALPDTYAPTKKRALEFAKQQQAYTQALESDIRLYRSLSTVGTSTTVFAHEALGPAGRLATWLDNIDDVIRQRLTEKEYKADLAEPIARMTKIVESLQAFARLPLRLVEKSKRQPTNVNVDKICADLINLFGGYLAERDIEVRLELGAPDAIIRAAVSDIEAILANLVMNAAHAFLEPGAPDRDRVIRINTEVVSNQLLLQVDDSGPGIRNIELHEIWVTGRSTRQPNGTGFGLTIVAGTVADLKGKRVALESGPLGGAHFEIRLPISSGR